MSNLKVIPYSPSGYSTSFKRIIIKPIPKVNITSTPLHIPTDINRICEIGIVHATDEQSTISSGDTVLYKKIDRTDSEHVDNIALNGEVLDVLYEDEVWAVNNYPFNRVFVEAFSGMEATEGGLLIPTGVKGVTQKGKVFRASPQYPINAGDQVEYRRSEHDMYPTIEIDGATYDVLRETDIFLVNGHVSSFRIIVRIDKMAQQAKQHQTDSGLLRSPLFLFMKFNLQYAEVLEIGEDAKPFYPGMNVGDTIIIHHSVEDRTQNYRVIKKEVSKHNICLYEHRIINAFDTSNREILGKLVNRDKIIVFPYGRSVFLEWNFDLLAKATVSSILIDDFETNLDKCHNVDDLNNTVKSKKDIYVAKAQAKIRGYSKLLAGCDPREKKDEFDRFESQFKLAQAEALLVANHLNANHLVVCRKSDNGERVVLPYKELYPIEILGKKFLVGWSDFVLAKIVGTGD